MHTHIDKIAPKETKIHRKRQTDMIKQMNLWSQKLGQGRLVLDFEKKVEIRFGDEVKLAGAAHAEHAFIRCINSYA